LAGCIALWFDAASFRTLASMPAITSQLDPRSQDFQDNVAFHRALVE